MRGTQSYAQNINKSKVRQIIAIFLFVIFGVIFFQSKALAANPILENPQPANFSTTATSTPTISGHFVNPNNGYYTNVTMTVDGNPVPVTWTVDLIEQYDSCSMSYYYVNSPNSGTFSYTPTVPLSPAAHTVVLTVSTLYGTSSMTWAFGTPGAPPEFLSLTPSGNIGNYTPTITSTLRYGDLDTTKTVMKLDGTNVTTSWNAINKTITYTPSTPLAKGIHNLNISVTDILGVTATQTGTFTILDSPVIQSLIPSGIITNYLPTITGTIIPGDGTIDPSKTVMKLDGVTVTSTWNATTKTASFTPVIPIAAGTHNISLTVTDSNGLTATTTSSFIVNVPPVIQSLTPSGTTDTYLPTITGTIGYGYLDTGKNILKIDGVSVATTWNSTDKTISYTPSTPLAAGNHDIFLSVTDTSGLTTTQSISINIVAPPIIQPLTPSGTVGDNTPTISGTVSMGTIDPTKTLMQLDTVTVTTVWNETTKTVSYTPATPLEVGIHSVFLSVTDINGLTSVQTVSFEVLAPPVIQSITPTGTIDTSTPTITATIGSGIIDSSKTVLKIDGTVVTSTWNSLVKTITYTPTTPLAGGNHTIYLSVTGTNGLSSNQTVNINVVAPPVIQSLTATGTNGGSYPTITAVIGYGNIDTTKTILKLDGVNITPTWNGTSKTYTYTAASPVANGDHNISLTVTDVNGLSATKTGTFTQNSNPSPVLSGQTPTGTITSFTQGFQISLKATDPNQINKSSAIVKFNGVNIVPPSIVWGGYWEYDPYTEDEWYVENDPTNATIFHVPSSLKDGTQTVDISVANNLGYSSRSVWTFDVAIKPKIESQIPIPNAVLTNNFTPTISAKVTDNDSLDLSKTIMKINGQTVTPIYNATTNILSYIPTVPLPNETYTVVEVTAVDNAGNSTYSTWQFYDYNYADMPTPPADSSKCYNCHTNILSTHPTNNCDACHVSGPVEDCRQCHGSWQHGAAWYLEGYSDWSSGYNCVTCHYNTYPAIPQKHIDTFTESMEHISSVNCSKCHSVSLTREHYRWNDPSTGAKMTCNTCHYTPPSSMATDVKNAIATKNTRCDACHKANDTLANHPDHSVVASFTNQGCQACHKTNIATIDQHAITGKVCTNCHINPPVYMAANTQNAITNHNKDCAACHTPHPDNDAAHNSTFIQTPNVDCLACHKAALNQEHIGKLDSQNNSINCATCHSSTDPNVVSTINAKKTNCDGCHTAIHTDNDTQHSSTYVTSPQVNCAKCHNSSLNIEHANRSVACNICHNSVQANVKTAINNGNNGNTKCDACHTVHTTDNINLSHQSTYIDNKFIDCSKCHLGTLSSEHLGKIAADSSIINCNTCHNSSQTNIINAIANGINGNTKCDACHNEATLGKGIHTNVDNDHISTYITNPQVNCAECHQSKLNIEHANRNDLSGNPYNCATCHNSTNQTYQDAISNNAKNCDACHSSGTIHTDLDTQHISTFVTNPPFNVACSNCHQSTLNTEHLGKIAADYSVINCNTCHSSANSTIQTTITTQKVNCDACHNVATLGKDIHTDYTSKHISTFTSYNGLNCASCHNGFDTLSNHVGQAAKDGSTMTCSTCHDVGKTAPKDNTTLIQNLVNTNGVTDCSSCHKVHSDETAVHTTTFPTVTGLNCANCHSGMDIISSGHVGKLAKDGSTMDCNTCHGTGKTAPKDNTPIQTVINNVGTIDCSSCHNIHSDVNAIHTVSTYATTPPFNLACTTCHKTSLNEEHIGKLDNSNNTITCDTCHQSNNLGVQTAISTGKSNCDACHVVHPSTTTDTKHTQTFPAVNGLTCNNCHSGMDVVSTGHVGKLAKDGSTMDCNTCHGATSKTPKDGTTLTQPLIASGGVTDCSSCHNIHSDVTTTHTTTFPTVTGLTCSNCHSGMDVISSGHVGKAAKDGSTMDCNTCHGTGKTAPKDNTPIQTIINNGGTINCSSCHNLHSDVNTLHTVGTYDSTPPFNLACTTCHQATLNAEHIGKLDSNNNTISCNTCHQSANLGVQTAISTGNSNCDACHNTITLGKDIHTSTATDIKHTQTYPSLSGLTCNNCHSGMDVVSTGHVGKVAKDGSTMDCNTCHGATSKTPKDGTTLIQPLIANGGVTDCSSCHNIHSDVTTSHTTTFPTVTDLTCANCHSGMDVISSGHVGKLAKDGSTMGCNTCHGTGKTAPKDNTPIQTIINNGGTINCSTCHNLHSDVNTLHVVGTYATTPPFSLACSTCHQTTLNAEHIGKLDSSNNAITCDTCHQSANLGVQTAISTGNSNCDACHNTITLGKDIHTTTATDIKHTQIYPTVSGLTCNNCHSGMDVVSTGHVGKLAKDGSTMDCNTCHGTGKTAPKDNTPIQTIINNGGTINCSSCHNIHADVNAIHNVSTYANTSFSLDCSTCHQATLNAEHIGKLDSNNNSINCDTCHQSNNLGVQTAISTGKSNCDACHVVHPTDVTDTKHIQNYPTIDGLNCNSCHSSMYVISSGHVGKLAKDGSTMDCNTCHGATSKTPKDNTTLIQPLITSGEVTDCSSCHDIHSDTLTPHNSNYVATKLVECSGCHDSNLSTEHAKKIDPNGNALTCSTCHASTSANVVTAIKDKITNCDACHTISHNEPGKIETSHTVTTTTYVEKQTFDCSGCHQTNLAVEHMSRLKPDGTRYDCNTCHEDPQMMQQSTTLSKSKMGAKSINPNIKPINIAKANPKCDTCHVSIHNVNEAHYKQYDTNSKSQCLGCHKIHPKK